MQSKKPETQTLSANALCQKDQAKRLLGRQQVHTHLSLSLPINPASVVSNLLYNSCFHVLFSYTYISYIFLYYVKQTNYNSFFIYNCMNWCKRLQENVCSKYGECNREKIMWKYCYFSSVVDIGKASW